MNSSENASQYVIANGPQGLKDILESHYEKCQRDLRFASEAHYIMYQFGAQKSLIKVDMSKRPYQFWYYDLLNRPITAAVKDAIAQFMADKFEDEAESQVKPLIKEDSKDG